MRWKCGRRFTGQLTSLQGKGGKEKELPVHHKLEEILDQHLKATDLEKELGSPLFPAALARQGSLRHGSVVHFQSLAMVPSDGFDSSVGFLQNEFVIRSII